MMKQLAWITTCLSILAIASPGQAQQNMFSIHYSIGIPVSTLNEYISETSFRGIGVDYDYITASNISFGLDAGVNTFYERKGYDTYSDGTVSITGTQYRYTNSFPFMASVGYHLLPGQTLNPYVSLGLGTLYTLRDTDIGLYRSEVSTWQFSLRPEAGVILTITPKLGVKLAGKYYQAFKTAELEPQSYVAVDVGVVFKSTR